MAKRFRLTVVFDGGGAEGSHRSRQSFKGGTAVFSSRAESADDVIRELSRGAPAGTSVVTSDKGLVITSYSIHYTKLYEKKRASVRYSALDENSLSTMVDDHLRPLPCIPLRME